MSASTFMDTLLLWQLYLIVAVLALLSIEAGWRLGNHQRQRHADESKAPISAPVGATMGLLAFTLANWLAAVKQRKPCPLAGRSAARDPAAAMTAQRQ